MLHQHNQYLKLVQHSKIVSMLLLNLKVKLSLKWLESCVLTIAAINADTNVAGADSPTLKITDAKLYVLVVTLPTEDSAKWAKQLSERFRRPVY